jgi:ATP-dependent DNA ligase
MAAYSNKLKRFYTVCKLGTGFTKEQLKALHASHVPFEDTNTDKAIIDQHAR